MLDDLFVKRPKKKIQDLNIVPILDMLTTVIFFLLLSTTFMEYVKVMVPPSATSTTPVESKDRPKAYAPKLMVTQKNNSLRLTLAWSGSAAGRTHAEVAIVPDEMEIRKNLQLETGKLMDAFALLNDKEKTVQIGMGSSVPYQHLISAMDGARKVTPEVVLISYFEAEAVGGAP